MESKRTRHVTVTGQGRRQAGKPLGLLSLILGLTVFVTACGGGTATNTTAPAAATTAPTSAAAAQATTTRATTTTAAVTTATRTTAAATVTRAGASPVIYLGTPVAPANANDLRNLRGEIVADGSSTVFPITSAAAQEFNQFAPNVRISVGISGTGGGFSKFCNGETDIQDASRPITQRERDACARNGIEFIEIPVAYDGLSVLVNPQNTWVDCLTVAELKRIWEPGAQGQITNWSQVRQGFPNRPLNLYGPGTDSGTFDYFTQAINGKEKDSRGDFQASEDDNVLVTGIAGDPNALGYFGYAYYVENQNRLKLLAVDQGNGQCIRPSIDTIVSGAYQPLSRPIFIYVKRSVADRPEVAAFVNFLLSRSFTPIINSREVGYIPLPDDIYQAVTRRFNNKTTGTLFPQGAEIGATLDRYR